MPGPVARFVEIAKDHPLLIGGSVIVTILLIAFLARKKPEPDRPQSGIFAYTQDPNVIAAAAAQSISQNQTNADVEKTRIAASSLGDQLTAQLNAIQGANRAQVDINSQNVAGAENIADVNAQSANALATIDANKVLQLASLQSQTSIALASLATNSGVTLNNQNTLAANIQAELAALVALQQPPAVLTNTASLALALGKIGFASSSSMQQSDRSLSSGQASEIFENIIRQQEGFQPFQQTLESSIPFAPFGVAANVPINQPNFIMNPRVGQIAQRFTFQPQQIFGSSSAIDVITRQKVITT